MKNASYYIRHRQQLLNQPLLHWPGLGGWAFYFLLKVVLAYLDVMRIDVLLNLALVALLVVPLRWPLMRVIRQVVMIPIALALAYAESYLPPFVRLLDQWSQVTAFSWQYIFELLGRVVQLEYVAALVIGWIMYLYLARALRMTVVSILALLSVLWWAPQAAHQDAELVLADVPSKIVEGTTRPTTADEYLSAFYNEQAQLLLQPERGLQPQLDILIVNICSLSWDDLEVSGLQQHPLFAASHVVLEQFNSASSYSGPAALRVLQASCGHRPHDALFAATPQCAIPQQLAAFGFESQLLLNHNGDYDNFAEQLLQYGGFSERTRNDLSSVPIAMTGFDGQPIYDDYAVLQQWLNNPSSARRFGFYNSTSLHDGNSLPDFTGNSIESFDRRGEQLLNSLLQLYQDIEQSGRNVLVVIVPEHGAGLRGDRMQLTGLREIPSPALTHVPVWMRLFGEGVNEQIIRPIRIDRNTGPSAIAAAIYTVLNQRPFSGGEYDPEALADALPVTPWMAENKDVKVMQFNQQYLLKLGEQNWMRYPGL